MHHLLRRSCCKVDCKKEYEPGVGPRLIRVRILIANLGHEATANHLRHYTAILPPLAVDAGLGEIGRLGYLMTKEFGPRIRLSAVTITFRL